MEKKQKIKCLHCGQKTGSGHDTLKCRESKPPVVTSICLAKKQREKQVMDRRYEIRPKNCY